MKEAGIADSLTLGIVQTAYANGESTAYIESLVSNHPSNADIAHLFQGIRPTFVPTGVKHLHHAAMK